MKRAGERETNFIERLKTVTLMCALLLVAACTATSSLSFQPTATAVPTRSAPSPTATATRLPTSTLLPAGTPLPASTPLPTTTPLPTETPLPTVTVTTTPTRMATATMTLTPVAVPTIACSVLPTGSFLTIWQSDPDLQSALGCPFDPHPRRVPTAWQVQTAYQPFERGAMIWSSHVGWYPQPVIYVVYVGGTFQRFDDRFDPEVDPINDGETPAGDLVEPSFGFGKVWREQPGIREQLGWATAGETPGVGYFQMLLGGNMVWISQTNQTYVLLSESHIVHVFDVPFSE